MYWLSIYCPLCSKCTFFACFAIMELNLVNISPLPDGTMLSFVRGMHWRDTGGGRSLSPWYQYALLSRLLQHMAPMAPGSCSAWRPVAHGTSPRARIPLNSRQSNAAGATPPSAWLPSNPFRQLPVVLESTDSQRVLLARNPQPTALPPREPQLHPFSQGLDLSSVGGNLYRVGGCS